jgi:hypothetical protein
MHHIDKQLESVMVHEDRAISASTGVDAHHGLRDVGSASRECNSWGGRILEAGRAGSVGTEGRELCVTSCVESVYACLCQVVARNIL